MRARLAERHRTFSLAPATASLTTRERLLRMVGGPQHGAHAMQALDARAIHEVPLRAALADMVRHPWAVLRAWNWKSAVFSAAIRAAMFLRINLCAGHGRDMRAMLVEAIFATLAAGLTGAVTQRLRHAVPRRLTALVVWLVLPLVLLLAQAAVHHAMGTPRLRSSLLASFVFAALASGFNWFAMTRGVFVTGERRSFARDLLLVPRLLWQFVTAPLRSGGHAL